MSEKPKPNEEATYPKLPDHTQRDLADKEGKPFPTDTEQRPDLSPADIEVSPPWSTHRDGAKIDDNNLPLAND